MIGLEEIAESFIHSAAHEFRGSSPLYERLSISISKDPELLDLAAHAISNPIPMIFFAAVHSLLLNGTKHPLTAYFPDITPSSDVSEGDPYPVFRNFCLEHLSEIRRIVSTHHVQTNEVRRSACLLPAFGIVARQAGGLPLALVEIGASAGLNLLWDHYAYDYGNGRFYGDRASPVRLTCALRGNKIPPFPETLPQIASRLGLDLHPIDVREDSSANWLRAFIWPEHTARFEMLERAIEIVRRHPPELRAGDALEQLPSVMATTHPDTALCLFHTFVSNQMSPEGRKYFKQLIADYGSKRDIFCISIDFLDKYPRLELLSYTDGIRDHRHLANCSGHSRWMEWLLEG
ncbi:MAG: DUF2332 domain-containing protein [Deltaproteobacteria bacterium]